MLDPATTRNKLLTPAESPYCTCPDPAYVSAVDKHGWVTMRCLYCRHPRAGQTRRHIADVLRTTDD